MTTDSLLIDLWLEAMRAEFSGEPRYAMDAGAIEQPRAPRPVAGEAKRPFAYDPTLDMVHEELTFVTEALGLDPAMLDADLVMYAADLWQQTDGAMEWGDVFSRAINDISDATRWEIVDATGKAEYEDVDYEWPYTSENPAAGSEAGAAAPDGGGPGRAGTAARESGQQRGGAGSNPEETPPALADMPREEAARFIDPEGDAAKAQIDALEHDARMAMAASAQDISASDGLGTMGREAYAKAHGNMWMFSLDELQQLKEAAKLSEAALLQGAIEKIGFVPSEKLARLLESDYFYHDRVVSMIEKEAEAAGMDIPAEADLVLNPKWDDPPLSNLPMSEDVAQMIEAHADGGDTDLHMLASHMGWALRDLKEQDIRAVLDGRGDPAAQAAMLKLRLGFETMQELGVPAARIPGEIAGAMVRNGVSPETAAELTDLTLQALRRASDGEGNVRPASEPMALGAPAIDPNIAARNRQEADIAAQQPLTGARKTGAAQDPNMPEGLFGGPMEPTLIDLGDGGPPKSMDDLLRDLDADAADNATIRGCMDPKPSPDLGAGE